LSSGDTLRERTLEALIQLALEEDVGPGDWTTLWTVDPEANGQAVVVAKEELVVAGTDAAIRVFRRVDPSLEVRVEAPEGTRVGPEDPVLSIQGSLRGILTGERMAMNFLGRLSGVATLTRRFVDAVAGTDTQILDTRKTTPGWRVLEKEAVLAGGGKNHRLGLHDMVMVKDNHLVAAGGVDDALLRVREENAAGLEVEVEVGSLEELEEALAHEVDRILLDNMSLEAMGEAVARTRALGEGRPLLEASGNMTLDRVGSVAETGVDFISVGALTHSAPSADLSLRVLGK
jgi:nicotinate-nucleotide pyrophosphorylase (carboxylating)